MSMPLECIKTVIDTRSVPVDGVATFSQFWATGRDIVAAHGAGALFRGLAPNLVRKVSRGKPDAAREDGQSCGQQYCRTLPPSCADPSSAHQRAE